MSKQTPMLMESPLTNRVYVVTSYVDNGGGLFTAKIKHDVTEQIDALTKKRRGECEMVRDDDGVRHCKACEHGADKTTGSDGPLDSWNDSWPPNFCPYCGRKVSQ